MIDEKIELEISPNTPKINPLNIIPELAVLQTGEIITNNYTIPEPIKYSSQDTEESLKPFKIDRIYLEEDGSTTVYYTVYHSSASTELENINAFAAGSINMPVYDKAEAEKIIFEKLINKGWYS